MKLLKMQLFKIRKKFKLVAFVFAYPVSSTNQLFVVGGIFLIKRNYFSIFLPTSRKIRLSDIVNVSLCMVSNATRLTN